MDELPIIERKYYESSKKPEKEMFIGGKFIYGESGKSLQIVNPYNGEIAGSVPSATTKELKLAVEAAKKAAENMKNMPLVERQQLLNAVSKEIEKRIDEIAKTITLETGKPIEQAFIEAVYGAATFQIMAASLSELKGTLVESIVDPYRKFALEIWEPMGVVAIITPNNFPFLLPCYIVSAAIAAGNAVILKPASDAPLSAIHLAECFASASAALPVSERTPMPETTLKIAKFPGGALNVVTGIGLGEKLATHPDVDVVSITGAIETGMKVYEAVGKSITSSKVPKHILLELGGCDPAIVFADASLEEAVNKLAYGAFCWNGEVALSTQRIYVEKEIYEEFLDKFMKLAKEIKWGDPLDDETEIGPLINKETLDKNLKTIEDAKSKGAEIVGGVNHGMILEPTVIYPMKPEMLVSYEESFGPVVGIAPFTDEKDALREANKTKYGLMAAIFTENLRKAFDIIKKLESGTVIVNDSTEWFEPHIAFGGYKWSGTKGREGGIHAIKEFSKIKTIVIDYKR